MTIDTTNLCSHLQKKLFEPDAELVAFLEAKGKFMPTGNDGFTADKSKMCNH